MPAGLEPEAQAVNSPRLVIWVREHLRSPLYYNAYALIANQGLSAALGIVYWMFAARFYPPDVVGENSAVISAIFLLSAVAELSMKAAMVRFVPRAGAGRIRFVLSGYGINVATSTLVGGLVVVASLGLGWVARLFSEAPYWRLWLIPAVAVWCTFYVQDGVLTGLRRSVWVLLENTTFNALKILLLIVGAVYFGEFGIVASWFLSTLPLIVAVNILIMRRFIPADAPRHSGPATFTTKEVVRSVSSDYVGSLLAEACTRVLPLLVLALAGKTANAYFYQAWVVATPLYFVASGMASSFTAEAATDRTRVAELGRRILREMALVLVPLVLLTVVAAPLILSLFGPAYAVASAPLLRVLAVAALPVAFVTWYLSYARVTGRASDLILTNAGICVVALGLSYLLEMQLGILGVGIAWLVAHSIAMLYAVWRGRSVLG
jgi:O-antigen/teichoic acid export membrane protein